MGGAEVGSRVLRGGSWNNDNTENFRCAYRNNNDPANRNNNNGFRVASTRTVGARFPRKPGRTRESPGPVQAGSQGMFSSGGALPNTKEEPGGW